MIFGDAGSSWCKIYRQGKSKVLIVPTPKVSKDNLSFVWGTGHTAKSRSKHFENDLITLCKGSLALIKESDFTVLDLGSRDAKLAGFKDRRPLKLDWSVGCASATGATLEMLTKFYDVDFDSIPISEKWTPVTCGTYAVERIMDAVSTGIESEVAIGRFIHGLARNCFDFSLRPQKLYLSGGFTRNKPFLNALNRYTDVIAMGRTIPLCGLWAFAAEAGDVEVDIPQALLLSSCETAKEGPKKES